MTSPVERAVLRAADSDAELPRGGYLCSRVGHGIDEDPYAREWSGKVRAERKRKAKGKRG